MALEDCTGIRGGRGAVKIMALMKIPGDTVVVLAEKLLLKSTEFPRNNKRLKYSMKLCDETVK